MSKPVMLVEYIRKHRKPRKLENGRVVIDQTGEIIGVVVAIEKNEVGWSLWNKKEETREARNKAETKWCMSGMDVEKAIDKAERTIKAKFDKSFALEKAIDRAESYSSGTFADLTPPSIQPVFDQMIERSVRYWKI